MSIAKLDKHAKACWTFAEKLSKFEMAMQEEKPPVVCALFTLLKDQYRLFLENVINHELEFEKLGGSSLEFDEIKQRRFIWHEVKERDSKMAAIQRRYFAIRPQADDYFYRTLIKERLMSCTTRFASLFMDYDYHQLYFESRDQSKIDGEIFNRVAKLSSPKHARITLGVYPI